MSAADDVTIGGGVTSASIPFQLAGACLPRVLVLAGKSRGVATRPEARFSRGNAGAFDIPGSGSLFLTSVPAA